MYFNVTNRNYMKINKFYIPALSLFLFLTSCKDNTANAQQLSKDGSVETKEPNSPEYKPAFAGQTRIKAVKTASSYNVEILSKDLGKPWGIINLPDGRFLITDKRGYMNVVSADGKQVSKIGGFPKVDSKGQGGMLDVALDPDFKTNNIIYFSFSEPYGKGNHTAVAKGLLYQDLKNISDVKVIFRATPTYDGDKHYGSRLAFDKDGNLFVSTGERSDKQTRVYAQRTDNYLGKILKITKDGSPRLETLLSENQDLNLKFMHTESEIRKGWQSIRTGISGM